MSSPLLGQPHYRALRTGQAVRLTTHSSRRVMPPPWRRRTLDLTITTIRLAIAIVLWLVVPIFGLIVFPFELIIGGLCLLMFAVFMRRDRTHRSWLRWWPTNSFRIVRRSFVRVRRWVFLD